MFPSSAHHHFPKKSRCSLCRPASLLCLALGHRQGGDRKEPAVSGVTPVSRRPAPQLPLPWQPELAHPNGAQTDPALPGCQDRLCQSRRRGRVRTLTLNISGHLSQPCHPREHKRCSRGPSCPRPHHRGRPSRDGPRCARHGVWAITVTVPPPAVTILLSFEILHPPQNYSKDSRGLSAEHPRDRDTVVLGSAMPTTLPSPSPAYCPRAEGSPLPAAQRRSQPAAAQ